MTRDATQDGMTAERGVGAVPWRTQGWVPTWAYIPVHDAAHNVVCTIYPTRDADGAGLAAKRASLIAAAPDYDAAACLMVRTLGCAPDEVIAGAFGTDVLDALNGLRAAIAKAQGERS